MIVKPTNFRVSDFWPKKEKVYQLHLLYISGCESPCLGEAESSDD